MWLLTFFLSLQSELYDIKVHIVFYFEGKVPLRHVLLEVSVCNLIQLYAVFGLHTSDFKIKQYELFDTRWRKFHMDN